jgi:hypothetical protein
MNVGDSPTSQASAEQLRSVIDGTAFIEGVMDQIIEGYCQPRPGAFSLFWNVLLNTSVLPLGSKVKVVSAIAQDMGLPLERNAIHDLVALRNAFAHNAVESHPTLEFGQDSEVRYAFTVIKNSGRVSKQSRSEAFQSFGSAYAQAQKSLCELRSAIDSQIKAGWA